MARLERTGKRKPREAFRTRVPDLGHYFIVTETKPIEENYLCGLRDSLPEELQDRIVIRGSMTTTQDLVKNCKEQAAFEPQYGQPWIVFDRDGVESIDEILYQAQKEGIRAGWSNPCMEIWLEAYFGKMHTDIDPVNCCLKFAEIFEQKTGEKYYGEDPQIYSVLKRFGNEERAISIADNRLHGYLHEGKRKPSEMCPCTTVYKLVEEIRNYSTFKG